jgi:ABC-type antimicrobial peptide transport system permease subunit
MVLIGTIAGAIGGVWVAQFLESQLYGLSKVDLKSFLLAWAALLAASAISSALAASKALRASPTDILRSV